MNVSDAETFGGLNFSNAITFGNANKMKNSLSASLVTPKSSDPSLSNSPASNFGTQDFKGTFSDSSKNSKMHDSDNTSKNRLQVSNFAPQLDLKLETGSKVLLDLFDYCQEVEDINSFFEDDIKNIGNSGILFVVKSNSFTKFPIEQKNFNSYSEKLKFYSYKTSGCDKDDVSQYIF